VRIDAFDSPSSIRAAAYRSETMEVTVTGRAGRTSRSIVGATAAAAALLIALPACGGGSDDLAVSSSGPVSSVDVSQTDGQLVVRWEQTADSSECRLDYALASGETGSRSFGAISAVPVVEEVFDVPGEVVSASLVCI
jgi:hypothetical protein